VLTGLHTRKNPIMTATDRLNDALRASQPVRWSRRTTDHIGAFLTAAYMNGDEILAGTAAFPNVKRPPSERHTIQCAQCPATYLIGDTKDEVGVRFRDHQMQRHGSVTADWNQR
jgi:hypothetical protein